MPWTLEDLGTPPVPFHWSFRDCLFVTVDPFVYWIEMHVPVGAKSRLFKMHLKTKQWTTLVCTGYDGIFLFRWYEKTKFVLNGFVYVFCQQAVAPKHIKLYKCELATGIWTLAPVNGFINDWVPQFAAVNLGSTLYVLGYFTSVTERIVDFFLPGGVIPVTQRVEVSHNMVKIDLNSGEAESIHCTGPRPHTSGPLVAANEKLYVLDRLEDQPDENGDVVCYCFDTTTNNWSKFKCKSPFSVINASLYSFGWNDQVYLFYRPEHTKNRQDLVEMSKLDTEALTLTRVCEHFFAGYQRVQISPETGGSLFVLLHKMDGAVELYRFNSVIPSLESLCATKVNKLLTKGGLKKELVPTHLQELLMRDIVISPHLLKML